MFQKNFYDIIHNNTQISNNIIKNIINFSTYITEILSNEKIQTQKRYKTFIIIFQ